MPLIPRVVENTQTQPSAPVQIASTGDARIQGDAIASFGGAVEKSAVAVDQFFQKQADIDKHIKRAEFQTAVENVAKVSLDQASRNAAPDGSDLSAQFYKTAEPQTAQLINQYAGGDPELQKEFDSHVRRLRSDVDTTLTIHKAQMLENYNFSRIDNQNKLAADRLREDIPVGDKSVANFVRAEVSSNQNLMNGVGLDPKNDAKAKQAFLTQGAQAFIDGLGNKQRYGEALSYLTATSKSPDLVTEYQPAEAQALGMVTSKEAEALTAKGETFKQPLLTTRKGQSVDPAIAHLLSGLTEPQKAAAIDKMSAQIQQQAQVRSADLAASISGYEKFRASGGDVTAAERSKVVQDINALPHASLVQRQRLLDRVMTADAIGDQMKVAVNTPRGQLPGLIAKAADAIESHVQVAATRDPKLANNSRDFAVIENRQDAINRFSTSIKQMQEEQDKDPAGFLMRNDPEVALAAKGTKDGTGIESFTTTLMNKQKYLGIPQSPISKQQAYGIANQLKTQPDPSAANDFVNTLQKQFGQHFPAVMRKVAEEDKSLAPMQALVYANPYVRATAIDAIKNAPSYKIEFAKPERKADGEQIDANTQLVMSNFRTAVVGNSNDTSSLGVVQSMQDLIKIQAQRDVIRGADPKAAVAKAYTDVVDSNYGIASGGKSSVLVPRQIIRDPKIVESFLSVYEPRIGDGTTATYDTKADPNIPGGVITTKVGETAAGNQDLVKDFQLAGDRPGLRNMRWVNNDTQTGMKLVEQKADGALLPVYNKLKQPVEVKFDDINLRPGKKVIEQNKTLVQKLFGG